MKQIAVLLFVGVVGFLTGACEGNPAPASTVGEGRTAPAPASTVGEGRTAPAPAPRVGSVEWHRRRSEREGLAGAASWAEREGRTAPDTGAWRPFSREDPVTGRTEHSAYLDASNETKGHVFQTTPTLYVRCRDNKTDVFINWENYLDGNSGDFQDNRHVVTLRIGDGDPFTVRANVSTDNEATFFPSPIPSILRPAANADTLAARTTPYNESPQTAVFNVTGIRAALSDVSAACNWSF